MIEALSTHGDSPPSILRSKDQPAELLAEIVADVTLPDATKKIATFLLRRYVQSGSCRMTYDGIARGTGIVRASVYRAIFDLVHRRYFKRTGKYPNRVLAPAFEPRHKTPQIDKRVERADQAVNYIWHTVRGSKLAATVWFLMWRYLRDDSNPHYLSNFLEFFGGAKQSAYNGVDYLVNHRKVLCRAGCGFIPSPEIANMSLVRQHSAGYSLTPPSQLAKTWLGEIGHHGTGIFTATCGTCGSATQMGTPKDIRLPPDAVVKLFNNKGWRVHRSKPRFNVCPDCLSPSNKEPKEPIMTLIAPTAKPAEPVAAKAPTAPAAASPPSPQPRTLTPKEVVRVVAILEAKFDSDLGKYEENWDDGKVGDVAHVPAASVAKFRLEAYGPLKVFPDLEELKSDLAALRNLLAEYGRKFGDFKSLQQMAEDLGRRIAGAEAKRPA